MLQAGENLVFGNVVYVKNDGKLWKAQANAASTMPAILLALGIISADSWGEMLLTGFLRDDSRTFALGDTLYVSDTVAGLITATQPATGGQLQLLGKCVANIHVIYFIPSLELILMP